VVSSYYLRLKYEQEKSIALWWETGMQIDANLALRRYHDCRFHVVSQLWANRKLSTFHTTYHQYHMELILVGDYLGTCVGIIFDLTSKVVSEIY
jgi:hypothetical protein